jgi:hypothetical protein
MGQVQSQPDLSVYARKEDVLKQIGEVTKEMDKITPVDTQNFIKKTEDKAIYSDVTNTVNDKYITPLYWGERFNANKSSLRESEDNDTKFITPAYITDRKISWTAVNADSDTIDDKFVTPAFLNNRLTNAKTEWTANESDTTGNKFVTPAFLNNRLTNTKTEWTANQTDTNSDNFVTSKMLNTAKTSWTVSASNDIEGSNNRDDNFATPNWVNSQLNRRINRSLLKSTDNLNETSDDRMTTPGWVSSKIDQQKQDWTINTINDTNITSQADSKFVTPKWVDSKIKSFIPTVSSSDTSSDERFVTTKYLTEVRTATNEGQKDSSFHYVTPNYLKNIWLKSVTANIPTTSGPVSDQSSSFVTPFFLQTELAKFRNEAIINIGSTAEAAITNNLSTNIPFTSMVSNNLQRNADIHSGIADVLTNSANPRYNNQNLTNLSEKVKDQLVISGINVLSGQVANKLAGDPQYRSVLLQDIGENSSSLNIETRLKLGNKKFGESSFETSDAKTIVSGKFGNKDAEIDLNKPDTTNDLYNDVKNSYLHIRGAAKAYPLTNTVTTRGKRRVKISDDLLVDNKVAIGSGVDTIPSTFNQPSDNYLLKVGGSALFKDGIDIEGNEFSNFKGPVNITGNTKISGKVGIAADADSNFDLKVGGPATFTKTVTFTDNISGAGATLGNLNVGGPATFAKTVTFTDDISGTGATLGNLNVGGPATFAKTVTFTDNISGTGATLGNLNLSGPATFAKTVTFTDNISGTGATLGNLNVNGPATFAKTVTFTDNISGTGATFGNTNITGQATFAKTVTFTDNISGTGATLGNTNISGPATFAKTVTFNDNVSGTMATFGNINVTNGKFTNIEGITATFGNLNVTQPARFSKTVTFDDNINGKTATFDGSLTNWGSTTIGGNKNAPWDSLIFSTNGENAYINANDAGSGMHFQHAGSTKMSILPNGSTNIMGDTNVEGNVNVGNNVNLRSTKQLILRDGNHYLAYTDAVDGPRMNGFGGGVLSTSQNGNKDVMKWNKNGNIIVNNNIEAKGIGPPGNHDWFRIWGTSANGIALHNGVSLHDGGGLNVGQYAKVPEGQIKTSGDVNVGGNVRVANQVEARKIQATSGDGHMVNIYKNGNANDVPAMLVRQTPNSSWGLVSEFRTEGSGNDQRPSILFSSDTAGSNTWSVGFGSSVDNNFRIRQNHGHRNNEWGTARMIIDTNGDVSIGNKLNLSNGWSINADASSIRVKKDGADKFVVGSDGTVWSENAGWMHVGDKWKFEIKSETGKCVDAGSVGQDCNWNNGYRRFTIAKTPFSNY